MGDAAATAAPSHQKSWIEKKQKTLDIPLCFDKLSDHKERPFS